MSDPISYSHGKDRLTLVRALRAIRCELGIFASKLHKEFEDYRLKNEDRCGIRTITVLSLSTFKRAMDYDEGVHPKLGVNSEAEFKAVWIFLNSRAEYWKFYQPDTTMIPHAQPQELPESSPEADLAYALAGFYRQGFNITHSFKMSVLQKRMPGRYLMYRPDWRSATMGLPERNTVAVSLLDVAAENYGLSFRETQDFPVSPYGPILQINDGVLFCYGFYIIGLMNAKSGVSFKCVVIDKLRPIYGEMEVTSFCGKMFVASTEHLFPSQKIFCQRAGKNYKTGIFPYNKITNETARRYISTMTFPNHAIVT